MICFTMVVEGYFYIVFDCVCLYVYNIYVYTMKHRTPQ